MMIGGVLPSLAELVVVVIWPLSSFLVVASIREYAITLSKFKYLYFEVQVWGEGWLGCWWGS